MPTVIKLRNRSGSAAPHLRLELDKSHDAAPPSDCKPCQASRELQLAAAEQKVDRRPPLPEDQPAAARVTWSGPLIFESQMTGDGRYIEPNALTWDNLPIPLRFAREDTGEHNGAVVVGRILAIERRPGGIIWGSGDFDTVHPDSIEAARQVREQLSNGVSADLDNVSFEVRVARELLDADGTPGEHQPDDDSDAKVDENGRVTILDIDADAEVMDIDDARIRAATLVAVPAFEGARITIDDSDRDDESDSDDEEDVTESADPDEDLVAAGGPQRPPADWFTDPHLDGPTPLTVTDDGRIFGHLAVFDSCHTGFQQECVSPPRSASGYGYFRTGTLITDAGAEVPVGHITLDTFHAGKRLGPADTIAHYEHTGATVADVAAGEDEHGIWVAGALRPNLSDDQLRTLRSSPLSGDWRRIGGQLELVAALAVNVPGFPVPRAQGLVASSGAVQALVASGVVERDAMHDKVAQGLVAAANGTTGDQGGGQTINIHFHGAIDSASAARQIQQMLDRREVMRDGTQYLRKKSAPVRRKARAAELHRRVRSLQLERRIKSVRSSKTTSNRGGQ